MIDSRALADVGAVRFRAYGAGAPIIAKSLGG